MHTVAHHLTPTGMVEPPAERARRTSAGRHHLSRIAAIGAIAALSIPASAATASARPCSCDGDAAQDAQITQTWVQAQRHLPAQTAVPSITDKRSPHSRYHARH